MHLLPLFLLATTTTTSAAVLSPRCTPRPDPDLPRGYVPPAPCWQDFDTACRAKVAPGTEMLLDAKHSLAVIYGVSASCAAEVRDEVARTAEGKKNYGWVAKYGTLSALGDGVLVISHMPESAVEAFRDLAAKG